MPVKTNEKIGFMQGRLTTPVKGRTQSFPWVYWRQEFELASECGFRMMEWVIEEERLAENPIMNSEGRKEIRNLMALHRISIPSITCDTFIQEPFFKAGNSVRRELLEEEFECIIRNCADIGISKIIVPLVDKGSLENEGHLRSLFRGMETVIPLLWKNNMVVAFESDFTPQQLKKFILGFDEKLFGINYDTGNSASLGFDTDEEMRAYGNRVVNVHIKDRLLHGSTIALGRGNVDFEKVFRALRGTGYAGNYMLQTARDTEGRDKAVLCEYRDMIVNFLDRRE